MRAAGAANPGAARTEQLKARRIRQLLYVALAAAFVLRHDLWLWSSPATLFGLPVGLTYHVLFCLVVSLLMALLVRYAWPSVEP